jgi:hypothetical protein
MKAAHPNVVHWDPSGHLNPAHQRRLFEKATASRPTQRDDVAFISRSRTTEDIGEELGEAFVNAATSGQGAELERLDRVTDDELGGPFVPTTDGEEFAPGTDESNIAEATREPLPRTSRSLP